MNSDTLQRVIICISNTTRYPISLLKAEADIETDLGIDSVKRVEILIALSQEFALPLESEERDPTIRTIGDIAIWLERLRVAGGRQQSTGQRDPAPHKPTLKQNPSLAGTPRNPLASSSGRAPKSRFSAAELRQADRPIVPQTARNAESIASSDSSGAEQKRSSSDEPQGSLHGKVALVTGSGRGIGRTTARFLAARGATVVINSFHSRDQGDETAKQICNEGGSAIHLWGSIAKAEHVEVIFEEISEQFGGLDILVCNSSDGQIGSFLDLNHDDWLRAFGTNVIGHHHCAKLAFPMMRARGGGAMVTMSAVGAHNYVDGLGSQGVAKAAVESMTRYLACEAGRFGIRVNCVAGGPVYGELISKFPEASAARKRWENTSPDGELTSALDLAKTIAFLVSDDARGVNGAIWTVDHGFSATAAGEQLRSISREGSHAIRVSNPI